MYLRSEIEKRLPLSLVIGVDELCELSGNRYSGLGNQLRRILLNMHIPLARTGGRRVNWDRGLLALRRIDDHGWYSISTVVW